MVPTNLIVSFTGLCLFEPKQSPAGEVEVYLVQDAGHEAALFVRTSPGSSLCEYGYGPKIGLAGAVDLTFLTSAGGSAPTLPTTLADITATSGLRLDPSAAAAVPGASGSPSVARVTLRGGSFVAYQKGPWQLNMYHGELAFCVNWRSNNFTEVAELEKALNTISSARPILRAAADGNYRLLFANVPPTEMPPAPASQTIGSNQPAPHFGMYSSMLTPGFLYSPIWTDDTATAAGYCLGEDLHEVRGMIGSFIQCMVAQASR